MMVCYESLWPNNPFIFHIPYQLAYEENTSNSLYIKSPVDIRATVLTLLNNFADDDWIYWCIDDKYPIKLDIEMIKTVINWIDTENDSDIAGLLLCRTRALLHSKNLTDLKVKIGAYDFLERKAYHQIWIHQFLRVKVIRSLFARFPEIINRANDMDFYKDSLVKCAHHKLFVVEKNAAVFGESTVDKKITQNCLESMKQKNIAVPESLAKNIHTSPVIIGEDDF